eukprot:GFUD01007970.1.p1 GENE.GFUD01007970.1~~GFUD01007970.1.p1  ORF type:complete len:198 (+),score=34.70 GFUD01007970.1:129-722(+)
MQIIPTSHELAKYESHSEDVLCKPSKRLSIESEVEETDDESETELQQNLIKNLKDNIVSIVILVLLSVLMPSWDVYSDWGVTIQLFIYGDPLYAISMMVPQLSNILFTFFIWRKLEKKEAKRWSWILVITQCWPQFFAVRIAWMILKGNKAWRKEKKTFDSHIGTLEPYTESLPSVLILTAVWVTETKIKDDNNFQG